MAKLHHRYQPSPRLMPAVPPRYHGALGYSQGAGSGFDINSPVYSFVAATAAMGGFSHTRPGTSILSDLANTGVWAAAASGVMRVYTAGPLNGYAIIDDARTNHWANNGTTGAAAGTPGTQPTGMTFSGTTNGLTRTLAIGTASGMPYLETQYSGTVTTAATLANGTSTTLTPLTALGDQWCLSGWLTLISGFSMANVNMSLCHNENTSADAFLSNQTSAVVPTTTEAYFSYIATMAQPTVGKNNAKIRITASAGAAVNMKYRQRGMMLEKTGVLTPGVVLTTGTVAASLAEVLTRSMTLAEAAAGTIVIEWYNEAANTSVNAMSGALWKYSDVLEAASNRLSLLRSLGGAAASDLAAAYLGNSTPVGSFTPTVGAQKTAFSWDATGFKLANNGVLIASGGTYAIPSGSVAEYIAQSFNPGSGPNVAQRRLIKTVRRWLVAASQAETVAASL